MTEQTEPDAEERRRIDTLAAVDEALARGLPALVDSGHDLDESIGVLELLHRMRPEAATPAAEPDGTQIGRYRIERVLGEGGASIVYLAHDDHLRRQVAVKVLRGTGPDTRARFEAEAETLSRLQHPNIVQIFDRGEHRAQLYLVMEYVPGGSLEQLTEHRPQPDRDAARLVAAVARAVGAAHARGVLHRDLKPSNILLTDDGTPKVSDFGLACRLDETSGLTRSGVAVGTPLYMAPEQTMGQRAALGPATDVYTLGTLLYELLTGRPPFEGVLAVDVMWQIANRDPLPVRSLNPRAAADLETICARCLEKTPARRYRSAQDLADDLDRYLAGHPIHARPISAVGRLVRWTWRNPWLAVTSFALLVSLIGGFVASLVLTRWAIGERDRAEEQVRQTQAAIAAEVAQRQQAEDVAGILEAVLMTTSPYSFDRTGELAVRLDRAAEQLAALENLPELTRARLRMALGNTRTALGNADKGIALLAAAHTARAAELGADHRQTLDTLTALVQAHRLAGQLDRAAELGEQLLAQPADDADRALRASIVGAVHLERDDGARAAQLLEEAYRLRRERLGLDSVETLTTLHFLAGAYLHLERVEAARELLVLGAQHALATLGAEYPATLALRGQLAEVHARQGRAAAARALLEPVLEGKRRRLGLEHPGTLATAGVLAGVYESLGEYDRALPLYSDLLARHAATQGEDSLVATMTRARLGIAALEARRPREALPHLERAVPRLGKLRGPDHEATVQSLSAWVRALTATNQHSRAVPLAGTLLQSARRAQPPDGLRLALALHLWGDALLWARRPDAAETPLRESLALQLEQEAEAVARFDTEGLLGLACLFQGQREEAGWRLRSAYAGLKSREHEMSHAERGQRLTLLCTGLANLAQQQNKPDEFAKWMQEAERYKAALPRAAP